MRYFLRLLRKIGLLKRISVNATIKINGHRFTIQIINGVGLNQYLETGEPWMQTVLGKLIDPEKVFMDVGVNLGQTLLKVKAVDPDIHYVGFEPNPFCVAYVHGLVKANGFKNVAILPAGISDRSNLRTLYLYGDDTDTGASIIEGFRGGVKKEIYVPVLKLADLPSQGATGVIKIDVEGAELEVLTGLVAIIKRDRPYIIIEVLPVYNNENQERRSRQNGIEKLLLENQYVIWRIIKKEKAFSHVILMKGFGVHADEEWCDYILCPKGKELGF